MIRSKAIFTWFGFVKPTSREKKGCHPNKYMGSTFVKSSLGGVL